MSSRVRTEIKLLALLAYVPWIRYLEIGRIGEELLHTGRRFPGATATCRTPENALQVAWLNMKPHQLVYIRLARSVPSANNSMFCVDTT